MSQISYFSPHRIQTEKTSISQTSQLNGKRKNLVAARRNQLTFSFTNSVMVEADCCNDLTLALQFADGCSKVSSISIDPGAEL